MASEVMASHVPGNTKLGRCQKFRSYQLTLNTVEKYETLKEELLKLKTLNYLISCLEEAPTTGHKHIHIYIHFSNSIKLNKKILATGVHIEGCLGSPKQNIDYIKKDGHILDEVGEPPKQGVKITNVKELINADPLELPPNMINEYRTAKTMFNNDINIDDWQKDVKVYYIYGPSGIGKSNRAKDIVRSLKDKYGSSVNIVKYINNFWNGVGFNSQIAIYDDFRDSHMPASEFINFIDYNKHTLNIKGGSEINRYSLIIITSVQSPYDIYKNLEDEPKKQWLRRMEIINMSDSGSIEL